MVSRAPQTDAPAIGEFGEFGEFGELNHTDTTRAENKNVSGARIPLVQMSGGQLRTDRLNVKIGCTLRDRFS